jgi:hypothetical protein
MNGVVATSQSLVGASEWIGASSLPVHRPDPNMPWWNVEQQNIIGRVSTYRNFRY